MKESFQTLDPDVKKSALYGDDLAPIPPDERTWSRWNISAIWIGMAVCIPTYVLASYMMATGLSWIASLTIIGLANLIITVPMVLNGHAGVKYGIPFPVVGRSSFGTRGIHVPSILRAIVACGWFGIQTWIGGLAFYEIYMALFGSGSAAAVGLVPGKFIGFGIFWVINIYFIWKGPESIKWLETFAAPILLLMGIGLIVWGALAAGGPGVVLEKSAQLQTPTGEIVSTDNGLMLHLNPLVDASGEQKATEYRVALDRESLESSVWHYLPSPDRYIALGLPGTSSEYSEFASGNRSAFFQLRKGSGDNYTYSSILPAEIAEPADTPRTMWLTYLFWLTGMVGYWATMSISIADITRYAKTQRDQVIGQFLGLPGAMMLYSFVGIFVTAAAIVNFGDILAGEDAPWDPVTLLGNFDNPATVVIAQLFLIVATLSTNIAANVIAPANVFANLAPQRLSFRSGGVIAGIIGIIICPWWLLDEISSFLIVISGLLGPILGVMLCDYFVVRKKRLHVNELYRPDGIYSFGGSGINWCAMVALVLGVGCVLAGFFIPALSVLYTMAWFTGFIVAFMFYYLTVHPTDV